MLCSEKVCIFTAIAAQSPCSFISFKGNKAKDVPNQPLYRNFIKKMKKPADISMMTTLQHRRSLNSSRSKGKNRSHLPEKHKRAVPDSSLVSPRLRYTAAFILKTAAQFQSRRHAQQVASPSRYSRRQHRRQQSSFLTQTLPASNVNDNPPLTANHPSDIHRYP